MKQTKNHMVNDYGLTEDYLQNTCRYFIEGKCTKGDDCKYFDDPPKVEFRRELCKFYLHGVCSKKGNCTYMHGNYPCKYYHIGGRCYLGESCRLSHESLPDNQDSRDLLNKLRLTYHKADDSFEEKELAKLGIQALEKPPPGIGLLRLPPASHMLLSRPPPGQVTHISSSLTGVSNLMDIEIRVPSQTLSEKIMARARNGGFSATMDWQPSTNILAIIKVP